MADKILQETYDTRMQIKMLYISYNTTDTSQAQELSYRWQTARRICAATMACLTPKNSPLRMCHHAEFSRSTSTGVAIIRGNPKTGAEVSRSTPLHSCYRDEPGSPRSDRTSVSRGIRLKNWHPAYCFSRSLKVIGTRYGSVC